ncbi:vacuolar transporter chaperone [Coemansia pectinata]|uniref:Vacuolar transporter chaperone n=1 Tax=Coemansia pectinata TaxID=1052879 RepID=A0A9W8L9R6_9FUNG|nr:vacuolar transporter chaperone [Coemansia pectinata]
MQSTASTLNVADTYKIPEPAFAEWAFYNISYSQLVSLALTASLFVHMKSSELGHSIRACEHYIRALASSFDYDERLVGLGQTEEAIGAAMSQVLALTRFRRSNFTALWRQLARLRSHCHLHFDELIDKVYASALFSESSLETHHLFRISQLYNDIQAGHAASNGSASSGSALTPAPAAFPTLVLWRGWVEHTSVEKLHSKLCNMLSVSCAALTSDVGGVVHGTSGCMSNLRLDSYGTLNDMAPPSPPQTHKSSSASSSSAAVHPRGRPTYTMYLDNVATFSNYQTGLSTDASRRDSLSICWQKPAIGDDDKAVVHVCHDEYSGPWFAAQHNTTSLSLDSDHVLPFLHSELNLNKLTHSPRIQRECQSEIQDDEAMFRMLKREQLRTAQKIQKRIIMEALAPVLMAAEDRVEYVHEENRTLRVVLRRNVRLLYKDCASDIDFCGANGHVCGWVEQLFGDEHADSTMPTETLGFDLLEVHFGQASGFQPPDWLAELFFDSALVRPILDFDLYLHGIATLSPTIRWTRLSIQLLIFQPTILVRLPA